MLSAIGLNEGQECAYRALVALGAVEASDLAHRLALPEDEAVRTLRRLERQGLAARSLASPGRWVAAPPGTALGALLSTRRSELERAETAARTLDKEYRTEAEGGFAAHDVVEVVTGSAAVAHRCAQLRLGAAREVCALVTGGSGGALPTAGGGIRLRMVVERGALAAPGGFAELSAALGQDTEEEGGRRPAPGRPEGAEDAPRGARIRVLDQVPTELVMADRALAVVPFSPRTAEPATEVAEVAALVVHTSGLLVSLTRVFEEAWRRATPLRLDVRADASPGTGDGDDAPPDRVDLRILSLLLAGLTDASVAKQLGLGLRTVQRRVKRLMELAGVTTRLQLGWHAYERGWVARDGAKG